MALFTPETAAQMAHKRWTAEREAKLRPRILPDPIPLDATRNPITDEVSRVRGQIESLNQQLDLCDDPDTWDALTRSKERLFRIWARLAQLPTDPKPAQQRSAQSRPRTIEPTAMPQPAPATPLPVDGSNGAHGMNGASGANG